MGTTMAEESKKDDLEHLLASLDWQITQLREARGALGQHDSAEAGEALGAMAQALTEERMHTHRRLTALAVDGASTAAVGMLFGLLIMAGMLASGPSGGTDSALSWPIFTTAIAAAVLTPAIVAGVRASIRYLVIRQRPELGSLAAQAPATTLNAVRDAARRVSRVLVVVGVVPEGVCFFVYALQSAVPTMPRWVVWLPLCSAALLTATLLGAAVVNRRRLGRFASLDVPHSLTFGGRAEGSSSVRVPTAWTSEGVRDATQPALLSSPSQALPAPAGVADAEGAQGGAVEGLERSVRRLEQLRTWMVQDATFAKYVSEVTNERARAFTTRNRVLAVLWAIVTLIAGWLLSAVTPPTIFLHH